MCGSQAQASPTSGRDEKASAGLGYNIQQRLDTVRGYLVEGMTTVPYVWLFIKSRQNPFGG